MSRDLSRLLEHPAIWRGRSAARTKTLPTGFAVLDEGLPGGGWPHAGLIEILPTCFGAGELSLLLPALAAVTQRPEARWCAWVAPPLQPFGPALAARGVALERVLVVSLRPPVTCQAAGPGVGFGRQVSQNSQGAGWPATRSSPQEAGWPATRSSQSVGWAFEQTLRSGACDIALAWLRNALPRQIRRLHLAAERGDTLGVLFRPRAAARDSSPAILRIAVEPTVPGARITLLKSRGGTRGSIELALH